MDKSRVQEPASRRPQQGTRHGQYLLPLPPAQGPPPASHGLTQETTRPLKQGSLALSSEISSFTTLQADTAVRQPHWGLLPPLGSGLRPPVCPGCGSHGASGHTPRCQSVRMPSPSTSASGDRHHPSKDPTQGPWGPDTNASILLALCDSPRLHIARAGPSSQQASAQVGCGQTPWEMHSTQTRKLTLQERATTLLTCWPSQGDRNRPPLTTRAQLEGRPSAGPAGPTEKPQALKVSKCHQLYHCPMASLACPFMLPPAGGPGRTGEADGQGPGQL